MKTLVVFICIVVSINTISDEELWEEFKEKYNRNFKSIVHESSRFQLFQKNLRKIDEHNAKYDKGEVSYKLGVTKFIDRTQKKFKQYLNYYQPSTKDEVMAAFPDSYMKNLPDEVDWRKKGAMTPVKDQGDCSSCWAFATTASLESHHYRLTGERLSFSEQYLIDCNSNSNHSNFGCDGGLVINALRYIKESGIVTEEAYPYEGTDGICKSNGTLLKEIPGYVAIESTEEILKVAVATIGPVIVSVDATHMKLYAGGIYDDLNCKNDTVNHAGLVIGYGTSNDTDYWLVRNSWGPYWGEDGYIRMARNKDNQCGIVNAPVYPIL